MEQTLVKAIAKESDSTIISKLDEQTKEHLKENIQKTILERYDYKPLEHIQEMIDRVINTFEDDLFAINYIKSINYTIDDGYYEKIKEEYFDSLDDSICDWEDEFEKPKNDIRLNRWTLYDFIKIDYVDGIDLMVNEFENIYINHPFLESYKDAIEYVLKEHSLDSKPLTKRETVLITAHTIFVLNKRFDVVCRDKIAIDYNINLNTPEVNQTLLNNSYDVIIDTLQKLPNMKNIIDLLEREKSHNNNLFTNGKKLSKVKSNNHYMSFLYKCKSVYAGIDLIVFQEFVEALISGYMQYLEFENSKNKIKKYMHDLEVLQRYNSSNENDQNIQDLNDKVSFLSIVKHHQKFIPFKELSNRLEIDTNQMANYITNILSNGTHPNTIKLHFDSLRTIPKEICISKF